MVLIVIFIISGIGIITLIAVKSLEAKRDQPFLISRAISKGDLHTRKIYHRTVRLYSEGKEKVGFYYKKKLPIHSKNLANKIAVYLKDKRDQYTNNMRNSKLLKKSDGLSDFLKNMSDIEKGNGEIHDVYKKDDPHSTEEKD